jgi:hypothetical protein
MHFNGAADYRRKWVKTFEQLFKALVVTESTDYTICLSGSEGGAKATFVPSCLATIVLSLRDKSH